MKSGSISGFQFDGICGWRKFISPDCFRAHKKSSQCDSLVSFFNFCGLSFVLFSRIKNSVFSDIKVARYRLYWSLWRIVRFVSRGNKRWWLGRGVEVRKFNLRSAFYCNEKLVFNLKKNFIILSMKMQIFPHHFVSHFIAIISSCF